MADNDIPAGTEPAPAEAPATPTAEQIAEIVTKAIDARIPGLQSGYDTRQSAADKRIADLETRLRQSNMDEDEIANEANQGLQEALNAERAKTAALQAAQIYPNAYPVFEKLQAASTAEEQLRMVNDILNTAPASAAPVPPVEGETTPPAAPTPPVDPNQAPSQPSLDANGMDADKANRIIKAFGDYWPGHD